MADVLADARRFSVEPLCSSATTAVPSAWAVGIAATGAVSASARAAAAAFTAQGFVCIVVPPLYPNVPIL